ncbi:MAG TPA: hypothetical protein VF740_13265, partial [Candidatus Acidoferrum sp.]
MSSFHRGLTIKFVLLAAVALLFSPGRGLAQTSNAQAKTSPATSSEKGERWLHVRVISTEGRGDTVKVNVPLELAEKVLPAVNHDRLHNGKVKIDNSDINDVDLRAVMDAVRSSKDGEYVTVQGNDNDVRVAKEGNHLIVHVLDKGGPKKSQVEVKVPMKVVEALLSAGKDELDLVAALHALGTQGDVELVSVK